MEGFVYPPFSTYQSFRGSLTPSRSGDQAVKQPSWKQSKSSGISPFLGGSLTPVPSDYLDGYRRAQLQALLSQVSPGLMPRPRWANTKEVGVQVSLRADAAVQCSLGLCTLPVGRPVIPAALRAQGRLALYSPVPDHRRLFTLPKSAGPQEKEDGSEMKLEEQKVAEEGSREQQEGQAEAALLSEEAAEMPQEEAAAAPRHRAAFQVRSLGTNGAWREAGTCHSPCWVKRDAWEGELWNRLERNLLLRSRRYGGPHPGCSCSSGASWKQVV